MKSVVYFLRSKQTGDIKIGWTRQLARRSANLSHSVPGGADVLATIGGDRSLEEHLHETFAAHRLNGEWFSPAPGLLSLIEQIRGGIYALPAGFKSEPIEEALPVSREAPDAALAPGNVHDIADRYEAIIASFVGKVKVLTDELMHVHGYSRQDIVALLQSDPAHGRAREFTSLVHHIAHRDGHVPGADRAVD